MFNLSVALALTTYWCSHYFSFPLFGLASFGVAIFPLLVLVCSLVVWLLLLHGVLGKHRYHNRLLAYPLGIANSLALLAIAAHVYNAVDNALSAPPLSVDAIMNPGPAKTIEMLLSVCYPLSKLTILCVGMIYGHRFYRSFRLTKTRS